ncbi:outer membrane protein [Legionella rowbothamii]|uniref:outer membrane protein n=1 Tax=Legionella rowbothamii TaxID=96229 RepID=UPI0010564247|nr:hypothetical protein [Legionella rowbothamii]
MCSVYDGQLANRLQIHGILSVYPGTLNNNRYSLVARPQATSNKFISRGNAMALFVRPTLNQSYLYTKNIMLPSLGVELFTGHDVSKRQIIKEINLRINDMRLGISVLGVAGACFYSSFALAGESGIKSMTPSYRSVVSLIGGYASVNAGSSVSYLGDDDSVYTYRSSKDVHSDGFIGGFIGLEHSLPWYNVLLQAGVEYSYFGPVTGHGFNTAGIEPETSTLYRYQYRFQTQQVLASAKFLVTTHERYHPYASLGLGAAFNDLGRFRTATVVTGDLNSTPYFSNNNNSQFSYSLGAGVDVDVNQNVRVGLGYRFSGFGKGEFKGGHIIAGDYTAPVPFTYGIRNLYANQLVAQISYII